MQKSILTVSIFTFTAFGSVNSSAAPCYLIDSDNSRIDFSFRSTLHGVEGTAKTFEGTFHQHPDIQGAIIDGEVHIKTHELNTGHPKRDEHMFSMFDTEHYPEIVYTINSIDEDTSGNVTLIGELKIKDTVLPLDIPAVMEKTEGGIILNGETELSLKDYHLSPPSVALVIRVFDTIHVDFSALLKEDTYETL